MKIRITFLISIISALVLIVSCTTAPLSAVLGEARLHTPEIAQGVALSTIEGISGYHIDPELRMGGFGGDLIEEWAARDLVSWEDESKVTAPRIILAKLFAGRDIAEVNQYLLEAQPTAPSGSSWVLRPHADYDFTEIVLAGILHQFGDSPDILRPQTVEHLVDTLLIEKGYKIRHSVPGSLGLVHDTENHILMTEGSRYLRNLWLLKNGYSEGNHKAQTAEHAVLLANFIQDLEIGALHEFNSQPYNGYTMTALLIIDAYAEHTQLKSAVRALLDRLSYQFALSDMQLRRSVPFRRQLSRADRTNFFEDPLSVMMAAWFGEEYAIDTIAMFGNHHQALIAAIMPYRPGEGVVKELGIPAGERLSIIGRGASASPEIHAQGTGYLLSAGGVSRGNISSIVARPITLLLGDGAVDRNDCFYIAGKGEFTSWNNTGVHRDFAVANGMVHYPSSMQPVFEKNGFTLFLPLTDNDLYVILYDDENLGILALMPNWKGSTEELADKISMENSNKEALYHTFCHPNGSVYRYNPEANRDTSVMISVDDHFLRRDFAAWPRLSFDDYLYLE